MPWRSARTFRSAIWKLPMLKNLVSIDLSDRWTLSRGNPLVSFHSGLKTAGLAVVLNPVVNRRPPDQIEGVLIEIEEDDVTNDIAVIVAHDVLLGFADFKILEAVDTKRREQLEGIGPLHIHVCHVVRLVEEHAALLPGSLLIPPVRKLGRHNRINIRSDLGVSQEIHRIPGGF